MRAPYNTTFDAFFGPSGDYGPAGVQYVFGEPCRLVLYDQVFPVDGVGPLEVAWVTNDLYPLNPPLTAFLAPGLYSFDYYSGDQVSIPSGVPPNFFVTAADLVIPTVGGAYYRFRVVPLPYPI